AMVAAVVVVEARARSGALHTARAAMRLGKVVGACPGSPGTDALPAAGAAWVGSADDVVAALAGGPPRARGRAPAGAGQGAAGGRTATRRRRGGRCQTPATPRRWRRARASRSYVRPGR